MTCNHLNDRHVICQAGKKDLKKKKKKILLFPHKKNDLTDLKELRVHVSIPFRDF
jgi:hypothetical protein